MQPAGTPGYVDSFAPGHTALLLLGGAAAAGVAFVLYGLHVMGHPHY